jgi:hypothetical protein
MLGWPWQAATRTIAVVISQYDVTPKIDADYARLRIPTAYEVDGFAVVRDYEPPVDVEWDDARRSIEAPAQ